MPILLLSLAAGVTLAAVLLVAHYVGTAVAREVARALTYHDCREDQRGGVVVQFRR